MTAGASIAAPGRERRVGIWLWAIVCALAWHGLWWAWMSSADTPPRAAVPPGPRVYFETFQPSAAGADPGSFDRRLLWSPSLFSLVSPVGFSRAFLAVAIGARPPVALPMKTDRLLERTPSTQEGATMGRSRRMNDAVSAAATTIALRVFGPQAFPPWDASRGTPVRVELTDGLKDASFANFELARPILVTDKNPWEARAWMEFDAAGAPVHVFLDMPTESRDINRFILKQLHAVRLRDAKEGQNGYVIIRYAGALPPKAEGRGRNGL